LAGSGPVHMTGGVTALIAAIILGPRIGRFHDADGNLLDEPAEFPPHSVALQFLGTFCLWFGWYGFNPGSVLGIASTDQGDTAALVAVNTTLAACAGAISAMFTSTLFDWWFSGLHTYDLGYTMNGCLTGLVAITAGCASVDTWAAVIIGIFAGWFYLIGSKLLIKFRIDDAVDAIPVHMVGGAWGVFAVGLFAKPDLMLRAFGQDTHVGWFYNGRDATLLAAQVCGILFNFGWVFVVMGAYFYFLNVMDWFRIDPLEEEVGMDISRHKGAAWVIDAAKEDAVTQLSQHRGALLNDDSNSRRGSKKNLTAADDTPKKDEKSNDSSGDDAPAVPTPEIVMGDDSAHC
jgi:ammonium transporter, Amt family